VTLPGSYAAASETDRLNRYTCKVNYYASATIDC